MAVKLGIDTKGLNPAFLEAAERKIRRDMKTALTNASAFALNEAKSLAPVDTGILRESIESVLLDDSSLAVGTNVPYGKYQEYGTRKIRAVAYLRRALAQTILKFKSLLLSYR